MDHRRFGITALAPRTATVGMKIQASRSPLSESPEVRFHAVHAARFHRASLSLKTDLVRSTEGARHSPSGLDGNREATTGRGNIARPILTTRRREASRRRFLPSAKARSHTTRTVRSRRRSLKLVHARTRAAALSKGSIARAFTWLILPVVICLSQRLSHASVSTCRQMAKPRTAH